MDEHTISTDPLALTLASLSWSGWNAGTVRLPGPWHFDVPEGRVSIYAIRHGRCRIDSPIFTQPVEARQGDILIFPHGSAHSLQFAGGQAINSFSEIDTDGVGGVDSTLVELADSSTILLENVIGVTNATELL